MGKIFCLMGKSSTGKDTIYKKLLKNKNLRLKPVVPYTTRPIREGEQEGREYCFINEEKVAEFEKKGVIIELRAYNTFHGIWKYMTIDDGRLGKDGKDYLMIGTPEAYEKLLKYFGSGIVVPLLVEVDDGERLKRALNRERRQANPKYEEMCRRFLADAEDFSKERLRAAGVEKSFINEQLADCVKEITDYINSVR